MLYSLNCFSKIDNLNDRGGVTSTVVAGEESEVACEGISMQSEVACD